MTSAASSRPLPGHLHFASPSPQQASHQGTGHVLTAGGPAPPPSLSKLLRLSSPGPQGLQGSGGATGSLGAREVPTP